MNPHPAPSSPSGAADIDGAAALWVLRLDRGLTAAEQDEFSQWLAADARHGAALAEHRWGWEELDRVAGIQTTVQAPPDPDLLAPVRPAVSPRRALVLWLLPLAAAAAVVLGLLLRHPPAGASAHPALAAIEQRQLPDGSTVSLNHGAVLTELFTAAERRVRLERGEAHFDVARNPARPFVVEAAGVVVRAVGTAFNVRLEPRSVEVLVTEGRVRVDDLAQGRSLLASTPTGEPPVLSAGQSATIALAAAVQPAQVAVLSPDQIEARLVWQPRLLDFTAAPLTEIVAEFNRHNPVRLVLADPALGSLRLGATFRSDNVEGFVRLMESDFGIRADWRGEDEIVLTRAR